MLTTATCDVGESRDGPLLDVKKTTAAFIERVMVRW